MKVAIVTGATSGIGWEAARQIDERFAGLDEIWLIGRKEEKLLTLSKQLKHSVRTFCMDLLSKQDRGEFTDFLKKARPSIRMLFQSAGVGLHGRFADRNLEDSLEMIQINCEALTYMTAICLPYMKANSHIIHMASSAGFVPFPGYAVYGASKSYVISFSRALRTELRKRKIHVLAVCPGPVNTPFFDISERYTKGISSFKRSHMNSPAAVVRRALSDAALHKSVSVDHPVIALFRLVSKTMPHDLVANVASVVGDKLG